MQNTADHLIELQNFLDSQTVCWIRSIFFSDIEMEWLFKSILFKMNVNYVYHIHNKTWLPDEIVWTNKFMGKGTITIDLSLQPFRIMFSSNDNN